MAYTVPLNTAKNPNRETHLRSVVFWNSAGFSLVFFANVNARSPLASIIQVFGHVGRDLPETHMQPATYCALCSNTVEGSEKSRMRTTYQNNLYEILVYEILVFSRMRFSCQKPEKLWVFLAV